MKSRLSMCIALACAALAAPALAVDYPEERGVVPSAVPPSPDETGKVNNVPQWRGEYAPASPVAPASAEGAPSVTDFYVRYDTNRDALVSWQEAQADPDLVRVFPRADANRDGVLTYSEFENAAILAHNEAVSPRG